MAGTLYRFMTHVMRNSGSGFLEAIDELGLSPTQIRALNVLATSEASPLTVNGLADKLGCSQPTASRIVAALGSRGYVGCTVSDADRRSRQVTVTSAGRALVARLAAVRVADLELFIDTLSADGLHELDAALRQLDVEAVQYIQVPDPVPA